jgi:hypothetical protein
VARGEDRGRSNRRWLVASVIMGTFTIFVRVAAETRNLVAGLFAAAGMVVFIAGLVVITRRRSDRRAAAYGPLKVELLLDFGCLPGEWPELALETLPAAAANTPGLGVTVEGAGGWLRIDKRRVVGTGRHPFSARVPLAAVRDVWASKSALSLMGASLVFELENGAEVRGDVAGSVEEAEAKAESFREAVAAARVGPPPGPLFLVVTSPPPPLRTSPGRAWALVMASMAPFAVSLPGAQQGAFGLVATMCVFFLALGLNMKRPVSMPMILTKGHVLAGLAFGIDAALTGQPLRLVGTAACIACIAWMTNLSAPGHRAPGPA